MAGGVGVVSGSRAQQGVIEMCAGFQRSLRRARQRASAACAPENDLYFVEAFPRTTNEPVMPKWNRTHFPPPSSHLPDSGIAISSIGHGASSGVTGREVLSPQMLSLPVKFNDC